MNKDLSKEQCQEIVDAFIDCIADNPPLIGDASLLPFPKSVILYAIGEMLNHYERRQESTDDTDLRKPYDDIIPKMQFLSNALIYHWHEIDAEDKDAVAALNGLTSFPPWGQPLKEKYLDDEKAANEALDAALNRMKRKVAAEIPGDE